MCVIANADEHIEHLASVRLGVTHTVRGQKRQAMKLGQGNQFIGEPVVAAKMMALDFNKDICPAESADQFFKNFCRPLFLVRCPWFVATSRMKCRWATDNGQLTIDSTHAQRSFFVP